MTAKERERRIKLNNTKYGLTKSEIRETKMPKAENRKKEVVLTLEQIFNLKSNFSVVEKL